MRQSNRSAPTRRLQATIAVSLLGVALLGACSAPPALPSGQASASTTAHDAAWQERNHRAVYAQRLSWGACDAQAGLTDEMRAQLQGVGVDPDQVQCTTVEVPLDWENPADSRRAEVAVLRVRSTGSEVRGSLFGNPGGPGVPGRSAALLQAASPGFEKVLANYDIIGFDPRGIGASTPLRCESDSGVRVVRVAGCLSDPIAHHMSTSQVARDMELIRNLVGSTQLDYLGYSYGTMLGATYATLFPDKAGRMVLDSAEDAGWAGPRHTFDQQVAMARAITALAESCASLSTIEGGAPTCPFTSEAEVLALRDQLNATPWTSTDGQQFTGEDLVNRLMNVLYESVQTQGSSLDELGRAKAGDQQAIDALVAANTGESPAIDTAGDIVACHSFPRDPDINGLARHVDEVGVPELLGGQQATEEILQGAADLSCRILPGAGQEPDRFDATATQTPILVVGVTGDHATPYQFAGSTVDQLGNAVLLTLEGRGHGASYAGRSSCIDKAVTAYLVDGQVPQHGTVCTDD